MRTLILASSTLHFQALEELTSLLDFLYILKLLAPLNRWNLLRKQSHLFRKTIIPFFLIQNEQYGQVRVFVCKYQTKTKISFNGGAVSLKDDYYQTSNFGSESIQDITVFGGQTLNLAFEKKQS